MAIGGVFCRTDFANDMARHLEAVRLAKNIKHSMQWKHLKGQKVAAYTAYIDEFFNWHRRHHIDFSVIVVDTHKVRHSEFNRDADSGFFTFLFQHYFRYRRVYGKQATFRCFHGNMDSRYKLRNLRTSLNAATGFGQFPYRTLQYSYVRENPLLQISDILIGAVGFATHPKHLRTPDSPKAQIAEHIRKSAGLATLAAPTPKEARHFNIWHLELQDVGARGSRPKSSTVR